MKGRAVASALGVVALLGDDGRNIAASLARALPIAVCPWFGLKRR